MAINPETQYPGKIAPGTSDYPYGAARNITVPNDGTGTPWEAALVNDIFGFQQALLSRAGEVPSGSPDKVGASQYLKSLEKITAARVELNSDILTTDFTGVTAILSDGGATKGDGYQGRWAFTGVTTLGKAGTEEGWRDVVYDDVGNEFKRIDRFALVVMMSGQSNAVGSSDVPGSERPATGGSEGIESGVYAWDYTLKQWKVPVWGDNPLATSGSNNAGIEFANEIKRLTGRDVYLFVNGEGGKSISNWVSAGTSSLYWADDGAGGSNFSVLTQLNDSGVENLDITLWMQGEQDHDGRTPGYDTFSEYKTALDTLITQFKGLSETNDDWQFITSGVGEWFGQTGYARNDVLQNLQNDTDPRTSNISTNGTTYNPNEGVASSHFDFYSLRLIGRRFARKYLGLNTGDASVYAGINRQQGATLPKNGVFVDLAAQNIDPMNLKGGAYYQVSNTSFNLPDPKRFDGATVIFNVTTHSTSDSVAISVASGDIYIDGETSIGSSVELYTAGIWEFKSLNDRLYLVRKPDVIKNFDELTVVAATQVLNANECHKTVWRCDGATLSLPDPALLTGLEFDVIVFATANGNTTINIDGGATGKFLNSVGAVVDTLTMSSTGNNLTLKAMNTRWTILRQSF